MPSKSKVKGNRVERDIANYFGLHGIKAVRAWGSNGKAFGLEEEVDLLLEDYYKLQVKARKAIPKWIGLTENVNAAIIKEDRNKAYVLMTIDEFIRVYKNEKR